MLWPIIAVLIIAADQITKYAVSSFKTGDIIASLPGVNITYVQNTGAAFSLLSGKISFLTVISIAFCVAAVVYFIKKRPRHPVMCSAVTLMFSGALANALDRIFRGFVVDFISVTFINFPVFNIADIAITVGAVLLVLYEIFFDKAEK